VSFDAAGTLFEVREPVGETYARLARVGGFPVSSERMESGFRVAFGAAPPLVAPARIAAPERRRMECARWRAVVDATLDFALDESARAGSAAPQRAASRNDEAARAQLFEALFEHYARADAWRLFPDTLPCLAELAGRGLRLAVISNFDGRLHGLLDGLGLRGWFRTVVASTEVGSAKPDAAVFGVAARALGRVAPGDCVHVGDSLSIDARGALAAGWRAVWLIRGADPDVAVKFPSSEDDPNEPEDGIARISSLAELPSLLARDR
jgi:putative hydrolase of the HAD superfamily